MVKNLGNVDKVIRSVVGLVFIYLGIIDDTIVVDQFIKYVFISIGIISLLVAVVGNCPLYTLIGVNTSCEKN